MNEYSSYGNYNSDDIRRYLEGKMSPEEMHLIEKAALDDPFLSDAIDGLRLINSPQQEADLIELKERLEERTEEKKSNRFVWWRMAAMLVLVLGASLATWYLSKPATEHPAIAKIEELRPLPRKDSPPPQMQTNDTATIEDDKPAKTMENKELLKTKNNQTPETKKDQEEIAAVNEKIAINQSLANLEKEKSSTEKPAAARISPPSQESNLPSASVQSKAPVAQDKNDDARNFATSPSLASGKSIPSFYFKGQVSDERDKPVPYASIRINNSNSGTYTDLQGQFSLVSSDSILFAEIVSVGYNKKNMTLISKPNPAVIHLETSQAALNEVVVSSQGKTRSKKQAENADTSDEKGILPFAEPSGGWSLYEIYIKNNLRIPVTPGVLPLHGTVTVSFYVNPRNGRLSDLRIEKSLDILYNKEAIRVLKDGPTWDIYNSDTGMRVNYTILY